MKKVLTVIFSVIILLSLVLTIVTFVHLEQDISTFPYGGLRYVNENVYDISARVIGVNGNYTIEFLQPVKSVDVIGYITYIVPLNFEFDVDGVYPIYYEGYVDTLFYLPYSNEPIKQLSNDLMYTDINLSVTHNTYVELSYSVEFDEGNISILPYTENGVSFPLGDLHFDVVSYDYNFYSFRNVTNLISSIQYDTEPQGITGEGWDFILSFFENVCDGFVWTTNWVVLPITLLGGVFIW